MFTKKNRESKVGFNPQRQKAILRCSICTGEQVACFKNTETGEIVEVCLIKDGKELDSFMEEYGISSITKVY